MKMNRDIKIDIDNNIQLHTLKKNNVTEKYVAWLNYYEIVNINLGHLHIRHSKH